MLRLSKKRIMKLNEISLYKINSSISKMKILLRWYEGKNHIQGCPLCQINNGANVYGCDGCPWLVIKDMRCSECSGKFHNGLSAGYLRQYYKRYPKWTERRISELKDWIKLYERYLLKAR